VAYANIGLDYSTGGPSSYVNGTRTVVGGSATHSGTVSVPAGITEGAIQLWLFGLNGEAVLYHHEFK
jgi:hypothetical protein